MNNSLILIFHLTSSSYNLYNFLSKVAKRILTEDEHHLTFFRFIFFVYPLLILFSKRHKHVTLYFSGIFEASFVLRLYRRVFIIRRADMRLSW